MLSIPNMERQKKKHTTKMVDVLRCVREMSDEF